MRLDVELVGKRETQRNLQRYLKGVEAGILRLNRIYALKIERTAKQLCPVDTGRLRASIRYVLDEAAKAAVVGTDVTYAPYVELGTYRMAAQPHIFPAFEAHWRGYVRDLKRLLETGKT